MSNVSFIRSFCPANEKARSPCFRENVAIFYAQYWESHNILRISLSVAAAIYNIAGKSSDEIRSVIRTDRHPSYCGRGELRTFEAHHELCGFPELDGFPDRVLHELRKSFFLMRIRMVRWSQKPTFLHLRYAACDFIPSVLERVVPFINQVALT